MSLIPLRASRLAPTRRGVAAIGVATLALSFVLSIAPVIAANGQGNANRGTVKIHQLDGTPVGDTDTDPHVCGFYIGFYYAPGATGTWSVVSWPGGDSQESGTYLADETGTFLTGEIDLDAGHYRLNWQGTGEQTWKHKMFWVDAECLGATDTAPLPQDDENEANVEPDESGLPGDDEQGTDGEHGTDGAEETLPESNPTDPNPPVREDNKSGSSGPSAGTPSQPNQPAENASPSTGSGTDRTAEEIAAGAGGDGAASSTIPDTSTAPPISGFLTAAGLLMVIGAHRLRLPDRRRAAA